MHATSASSFLSQATYNHSVSLISAPRRIHASRARAPHATPANNSNSKVTVVTSRSEHALWQKELEIRQLRMELEFQQQGHDLETEKIKLELERLQLDNKLKQQQLNEAMAQILQLQRRLNMIGLLEYAEEQLFMTAFLIKLGLDRNAKPPQDSLAKWQMIMSSTHFESMLRRLGEQAGEDWGQAESAATMMHQLRQNMTTSRSLFEFNPASHVVINEALLTQGQSRALQVLAQELHIRTLVIDRDWRVQGD